MKNYIHIIGARPNIIKLKAVHDQLGGTIIHTGQHYSDSMSGNILKELELVPNYNLGLTNVTDMVRAIKDVLKGMSSSSTVLLYGDTNSTLAGALAAQSLRRTYSGFGVESFTEYKIAHVEAGLRSDDWSMPEEANRVTVDHISDVLFCTTEGDRNRLIKEGISPSKIHLVGNVMVDTFYKYKDQLRCPYGGDYMVLTLHRPGNVDDQDYLYNIMCNIGSFLPEGLKPTQEMKFYYPQHPRAAGQSIPPNVKVLPPMGYKDFLSLMKFSKGVVTDSGGVQEESTMLGVPCITLRPNTERPITITHGTNKLTNLAGLLKELHTVADRPNKCKEIPFWDGKASERIKAILEKN